VAAALALVGGAPTACSGGSDRKSKAADVVKDGNVTFAIPADPGNLDPQGTAALQDNLQLSYFAYDTLLHQQQDGSLVSGLAKTWSGSEASYTFVLDAEATCSDGSRLTASDVAANVDFVTKPNNKSPLLGLFIPGGLTAEADDDAGTVTLKLPGAAPFFLKNLAFFPIVCKSGMADRDILASGTAGSGPYVLTKAEPSQRYVFTRRDGYTWGPAGATTKTLGLPKTVTFQVVANETTAANLLLNDQVDIANVSGADSQRLERADLFRRTSLSMLGEMFFNETDARVTSDEAVRRALTQGVDLDEVGQVLSGGEGEKPDGLVALRPKACQGNTWDGHVPGYDVDAAEAALDEAGWQRDSGGVRRKSGKELTITFAYASDQNARVASAAELAAQQWRTLGFKVRPAGQASSQFNSTLFGTGNWDVAWVPVNVNTPSQLVPFLSGPTPPDGTNFGHLDNAGYNSATSAASTMADTRGCTRWNEAEESLFDAVDVVPFVNAPSYLWGRHVTFDVATILIPTSLRVLE
jgi:peptide/nickel transport system substrate-binding protein